MPALSRRRPLMRRGGPHSSASRQGLRRPHRESCPRGGRGLRSVHGDQGRPRRLGDAGRSRAHAGLRSDPVPETCSSVCRPCSCSPPEILAGEPRRRRGRAIQAGDGECLGGDGPPRLQCRVGPLVALVAGDVRDRHRRPGCRRGLSARRWICSCRSAGLCPYCAASRRRSMTGTRSLCESPSRASRGDRETSTFAA